MEVKATAKFVRTAPNKLRQVANQIRDLPVGQAQELLLVSPKASAEPIRKTLESAIANAENNHDLDADELRVATVFVDEGPVLRRFRPRAMGRATRIRKRTSHLTVTVSAPSEDDEPEAARSVPAATVGGAAAAGATDEPTQASEPDTETASQTEHTDQAEAAGESPAEAEREE